jgi:hypothetical protein
MIRLTCCVVLFAVACESQIGMPCDSNTDDVADAIDARDGTNSIVQSVGLDNCSAFCASTLEDSFDGARPYCTRECVGDQECSEAGTGFICTELISFGPLACADWENPAKEQPAFAGRSSEAPCESSDDCSVDGERCFSVGARAGTCGFVGRDCVTGADGGFSDQMNRYCAATAGAIAERDRQYGR